ncbi:30S ribosomal protein S10 [Candidatus Phytoplasma pini]|uniref:Small ribosomal subunit protein uS10 n=1 Tax=Candidatus Phytoplasma pini TaxID=267362 RepID=A0A559KJQ8_9MOLU|nr:30S ribosomal protein S10 [Candidatus Phytoplasma pini]TVY12360.1 30S ribosomal protein S10 [Candidatus Phytoplasma pini]
MAKEQEMFDIILKTYDHRLIDQAAKKIISSVVKTGVQTKGPISLPTKKEVFTVLRSPFVNKDSQEQFGRFTHKCLIRIINPSAQTIDVLTNIVLPSAIDIVLKNASRR